MSGAKPREPELISLREAVELGVSLSSISAEEARRVIGCALSEGAIKNAPTPALSRPHAEEELRYLSSPSLTAEFATQARDHVAMRLAPAVFSSEQWRQWISDRRVSWETGTVNIGRFQDNLLEPLLRRLDVGALFPTRASERKGVGGRPIAADWSEIEKALEAEIDVVGFPEKNGTEGWRSQADVEKWISSKLGKSEPASSTVRAHVSSMLRDIAARKARIAKN